MYKESLFLKIVTYGPLVFIPLIVIIVLSVSVRLFNENFNNSIDELGGNLYNIEKKTIINKILNISDIVIYRKSIIKDELTLSVKNRVEIAYKIADNIYNKYKNTKSEKEIKQLIITSLETLVWNDGESFIWIVDYDGIFNLSPKYLKHFEGKSIIDFQDATGRYVIQEEIEICKSKGEGFIWDTFTKANEDTDKQYKQVVYVKSFGHYNWYFGSAEYLDTATKKINKRILNIIKEIDSAGSHYIFLLTTKGDILLNKSSPDIVGKNISEIKNIKTKETLVRIVNSVKDRESNYIFYDWINPVSNKIETKYSFIHKIPNTDWIIGTGFYSSAVEEKIDKKKIDMYEIFYLESKYIIYISLVLVFIASIFSYYVARKLKNSFIKYELDIDRKQNQLYELNDTLELKVIERTSELEKIKNDFEELAMTDMMTNMHNRYSIMDILRKEIKRSHRYKTPLSIIMYDIDFFKKVNDTYGHDVGDDVLIELSALVKRNLRDFDILGRYGGEEFLILSPNTTLDDSKHFANRIREEVQNHKFKIVGHITISLGVVELKADENIENVFRRVDSLLYQSKNNGRNTVSF